MDPNEALERLRSLLHADPELVDVDEARQLFDGLDEWLSSGGFLPSQWER